MLTYASARVLLGWMDDDSGLRAQHRNRGDVDISAAAAERLRRARERVAARSAGVDQRDVFAPPPRALARYLDELRRHPPMERAFAEGWQPALIDLGKLCAFQQRVFTERADARVAGVDAHDPESIAAVALPVAVAGNAPAYFDAARGAWVITSPDPNLRIAGHFGNVQERETTAFGFSLTLGRSYIAAVESGGRYFLADGYHRSVAFLRRGIRHVPGLVRAMGAGEPFALPGGMLPPSVYCGDRPPQLADFLDDGVSMTVDLPLFRKIIVIQAMELMA